MDSVLSFGDHNFEPDNQISFVPRFSRMLRRNSRVYGVDGVFDEFGSGRGPVQAARIRYVFWIHSTAADMDDKRREIEALSAIGKQQLTIQPNGPGGTQRNRYCNARVADVSMPQRVSSRSTIRQRVTIDFEVNNPAWIEVPVTSFIWGRDRWAHARWGTTVSPFDLSGMSTDIMITPEGNLPTAPLFTFTTGSGQQMTGVTIQRLVGSTVAQEIEYTGTIPAMSSFVIDCRALSVTLDSVSAYGSEFTARSRQWMELQPGVENTIRVLMGAAGDACSLALYYLRLFR